MNSTKLKWFHNRELQTAVYKHQQTPMPIQCRVLFYVLDYRYSARACGR